MQRARVIVPLLFACASCGTPAPKPIPVTESRWDALSDVESSEFESARAAWNAREWHVARAAFERLTQRDPENILLGIWLQEAEIEAATADAADAVHAAASQRAIAESYAHRA